MHNVYLHNKLMILIENKRKDMSTEQPRPTSNPESTELTTSAVSPVDPAEGVGSTETQAADKDAKAAAPRDTKAAAPGDAKAPAAFTTLPMPKDGSCLYSAVSMHLDKDRRVLRESVYHEVAMNGKVYHPFLQLRAGQLPSQYIQGIRDGSEWATQVEIRALMKILGQRIVVIRPGEDVDTRLQNPDRTMGEDQFPVTLDCPAIPVRFNPAENHYDAIVSGQKAEKKVSSSYKDTVLHKISKDGAASELRKIEEQRKPTSIQPLGKNSGADAYANGIVSLKNKSGGLPLGYSGITANVMGKSHVGNSPEARDTLTRSILLGGKDGYRFTSTMTILTRTKDELYNNDVVYPLLEAYEAMRGSANQASVIRRVKAEGWINLSVHTVTFILRVAQLPARQWYYLGLHLATGKDNYPEDMGKSINAVRAACGDGSKALGGLILALFFLGPYQYKSIIDNVASGLEEFAAATGSFISATGAFIGDTEGAERSNAYKQKKLREVSISRAKLLPKFGTAAGLAIGLCLTYFFAPQSFAAMVAFFNGEKIGSMLSAKGLKDGVAFGRYVTFLVLGSGSHLLDYLSYRVGLKADEYVDTFNTWLTRENGREAAVLRTQEQREQAAQARLEQEALDRLDLEAAGESSTPAAPEAGADAGLSSSRVEVAVLSPTAADTVTLEPGAATSSLSAAVPAATGSSAVADDRVEVVVADDDDDSRVEIVIDGSAEQDTATSQPGAAARAWPRAPVAPHAFNGRAGFHAQPATEMVPVSVPVREREPGEAATTSAQV